MVKYIALCHHHRYAQLSGGIELLKCLPGTFGIECDIKQFSQLSFMQYMGLCVFSLRISIMMIVRMCVLYLIITTKLEVWHICLGLGHERMVCIVCLLIFLLDFPGLSLRCVSNGYPSATAPLGTIARATNLRRLLLTWISLNLGVEK